MKRFLRIVGLVVFVLFLAFLFSSVFPGAGRILGITLLALICVVILLALRRSLSPVAFRFLVVGCLVPVIAGLLLRISPFRPEAITFLLLVFLCARWIAIRFSRLRQGRVDPGAPKMKLPSKITKPSKPAGSSDSGSGSFTALIRWTYQIHTYFVVGAESEGDVLKQVHDLRNSKMCIAPKVSFTEDGYVESLSSSFSVVEICKDGHLLSPEKNTDLKE